MAKLVILFGDFNLLLGCHEKEGGSNRYRREIDMFQNVVNDCELRDLGFKGSIFTWQREDAEGNLVWERLDRFLGSVEWCNLFPNVEVEHFPIYLSDHALILLKSKALDNRKLKNKKKFRFEAF